jgi:hypothetical protein
MLQSDFIEPFNLLIEIFSEGKEILSPVYPIHNILVIEALSAGTIV